MSNRPVEFPDSGLKKETDPATGYRAYYDEDGIAYPSVTTIMSVYEDKRALIEWRNRVGEAEANRERQESADRGILAHSCLEAYIEQSILPSNVYAQQAIQAFYGKVTPIWAEKAVKYRDGQVKYAGTFDHLVEIPSNTFYLGNTGKSLEAGYYLCDFKTKKTMSQAEAPSFKLKTLLQGIAYIKALEPVLTVDIKGFVLVVATAKKARMWVSERPSLEFYWQYWYELLQDFYGHQPLGRTWTDCLTEMMYSYDATIDGFYDHLPVELV